MTVYSAIIYFGFHVDTVILAEHENDKYTIPSAEVQGDESPYESAKRIAGDLGIPDRKWTHFLTISSSGHIVYYHLAIGVDLTNSLTGSEIIQPINEIEPDQVTEEISWVVPLAKYWLYSKMETVVAKYK